MFKDHFSTHSEAYAGYRPCYPETLYDYLESVSQTHELAWDCATGSGQAAVALAKRFAHVIATDASEQQLEQAQRQQGVEYRVATAESGGLSAGSVDLISVAQALHWFNFDAFNREAQRVLKPTGVIAVWCYGLHRISPDVDTIVDEFYQNIVGEYWPPERLHIESGYRDIPFPFKELSVPDFKMMAQWNLDELMGYLGTWSATQHYIQDKNSDPRGLILTALEKAWANPKGKYTVKWPLSMRVGTLG